MSQRMVKDVHILLRKIIVPVIQIYVRQCPQRIEADARKRLKRLLVSTIHYRIGEAQAAIEYGVEIKRQRAVGILEHEIP